MAWWKWFRPNEEFWSGPEALAMRARLAGLGERIEPWEAYRDPAPEGEREASAEELLAARYRGLRLVKGGEGQI